MSLLTTGQAYIRDIWATFGIVHRRVVTIDALYVYYRWWTELVNTVSRLGFFVGTAWLASELVSSKKPTWPLIIMLLIVFALVMTVTRVTESFMQERETYFRSRLRQEIDEEVLRHVSQLDLGRLVDPAFLHLSEMSRRRGENAIESLWDVQIRLFGSCISIMLGAAVLLTLDPFLGVLAAALAVPGIVHRWLGSEKRRALDESETLISRSMSVVRNRLQNPHSAVAVRTLAHTPHMLERYTYFKEKLFENLRTMSRFDFHWSLFTGLFSLLGSIVFCLYFSRGLVAGSYTLVTLGAIFGSVQLVTSAVHSLGWTLGRLREERKDYQYLLDFLATKPLVHIDAPEKLHLTVVPEIVLDDISFTYPGADKVALRSVSTTLKPGEKVALVGPNGCGKTTLLHLLGRVYVPTQGTLWFDAHASNRIEHASLLTHVTLLPQAVRMPGMEMRRALSGTEPGQEDRDRLGRSLVFAGLDSLVATLPHGVDTFIGEEWAQGRGFSTGERQRLALAALFYRLQEPSIHIALLDEPTANCDADTKARVYSSLHTAPELQTKTVVVSLHDPLYLHHFDRVLVFKEGRLIEDLRSKDAIASYKAEIALLLSHDL